MSIFRIIVGQCEAKLVCANCAQNHKYEPFGVDRNNNFMCECCGELVGNCPEKSEALAFAHEKINIRKLIYENFFPTPHECITKNFGRSWEIAKANLMRDYAKMGKSLELIDLISLQKIMPE